MGNKVGIPRSFSDSIGVADVTNRVNGRFLNIPLLHPKNNTTTGWMWGNDSNTTGIPPFEGNVYIEKLWVAGLQRTTVNAKTTLCSFYLMKNGVSTVVTLVQRTSTTIGERWYANSTTPTITNLTSTDALSLKIITRNQFTRLSVSLKYRLRKDS
jgi:hypothetical protein